MKATLILVGTELLNGGMIDTNSIYMSEKLNSYGISIKYKIVVKDDINEIKEAIEIAKKSSDLVILSGGLGPTIDDLTKVAVANYLGKKLTIDKDDLDRLKIKLKERNIDFLEENKKEVEKVEGATFFNNEVGMAPGMYVDGIACFPGVPRELYNLFPKFLKWYSTKMKLNIDKIYIRDLLTYGIAESLLNKKLIPYFVETGIDYEFLIKDYGTIIRLQYKESNKNLVEKIIKKIYNEIGNKIFSEGNIKLEEVILNKLKERNLLFSVAESCTGGMISSKIVGVSGASEVYKEGLVTYSNSSKVERLGVKEETLKSYGAVSFETAKEMVEGLKTAVGISVTGIAGPNGGTLEKPVGLVYIGLKVNENIEVMKKIFKGSREEIREKTVLCSLFYLNKLLDKGSN
ncbi:CinA family nicotinamide mononucleotide deamidase-related protein [Fusobacterium sp. IOR10]|uniref:CinA family nicotinamide mononucleotide deamidase-related protein n=1 Tax=Fusobacterium sp. IOR10 TaxID=2665157 RepID=UPI0013D3D7C6|nr:CinA family nicotinamide mononucleotide deamidase-related protein [Fusobacterium sp. IOR10]